ncbi:MAG: sulfatase-like hydrolase/transferase, partial [Phycisphaerae bacterium]
MDLQGRRSPQSTGGAVQVALLAALVALPMPACDRSSGASSDGGRRPNVIVLLIDTLRADRLGFMGHTRDTSPIMDGWAEQGVVFERAYSTAPWTPPSVASIFSGLYPSVHHVLEHHGFYGTGDDAPEGDVLVDEIETLAEALRDGGYETIGLTANAAWMTREFGYAQGFKKWNVVP